MRTCMMKYIILPIFLFRIQTSLGQSIELHTVYFKKNSYSIEGKYEMKLKELVKKVKTDSCEKVKIFGFADTSGAEDYNNILAKNRAYSVYNFILSNARIDTSKFYVEWLGESNDAYDLHLPDAHVQQRTVDILVQYNGNRRRLSQNH